VPGARPSDGLLFTSTVHAQMHKHYKLEYNVTTNTINSLKNQELIY